MPRLLGALKHTLTLNVCINRVADKNQFDNTENMFCEGCIILEISFVDFHYNSL